MFEAELEMRLNDIQFAINRIRDYEKMLKNGEINEEYFKDKTKPLFECLLNHSFNAFNFSIGV